MNLLCVAALLLWGAAPAHNDHDAASPNAAQEVATADAKRIHEFDALRKIGYEESHQPFPYEPDAPFHRYFWVQTEKEHRQSFLVVFCAHLNKLSVRGKLKWPVFIAPDVIRIDVRDYGWDRNGVILVFEKTAEVDPLFHQVAVAKENLKYYYDGKDDRLPIAWPGGYHEKDEKNYQKGVYRTAFKKGDKIPQAAVWLDRKTSDALKRYSVSEAPILGAEWFFGQTCRQRSIYNDDEPGIGYYDFLALKDRDAFFELCGVDAKKAKKLARYWSAVVLESGISQQNRQVIRLGAVGDFVWGTLDTFKAKDRGILQRNLRDGEFNHDAEEWFGRLPNGMDVNALFNAKGVRQAVAPEKIGMDKSKLNLAADKKYEHNDFPVHTNLSCLRCHGTDDLLKDVDDWARNTFKQGGPLSLTDPDKRVTLELEEQYLRDVNKLLKKDRGDYSDSVKEVTTSKANPNGWTVTKFSEEYSAAWDRYANVRITPAIAARELGTTETKLMSSIKAYASKYNRGQGDNVLTTWTVNKKGIKRTVWEQSYALAMSVSLGLSPPEEVKKERIKPQFEK